MGNLTGTIPQIADGESVAKIDAFLTGLIAWMLVFENIANRRMALRVGGYGVEGQKPLLRDPNPDERSEGFERDRYNSMTIDFESEDALRAFARRHGR